MSQPPRGVQPGTSRLWRLARYGFRPTVLRSVTILLAIGTVAWGFITSMPAQPQALVVPFMFSTDAEELLARPISIFNAGNNTLEGRPIRIEPHARSSGTAEALIRQGAATGDPEVEVVAWLPASSIWGRLLNNHTASQLIPPGSEVSIVQSPQIIAIWEHVYDVLIQREPEVGWDDLFRFATSEAAWTASVGEDFGQFRLAQPNPASSTSGLSAAISEYYAAAGKTEGLMERDVREESVRGQVRDLQQVLAHFGPTADDLLNEMACHGPGFATAVYIQETSLIRFNDRRQDEEEDCLPREGFRLRAIYPSDGTFVADYPFLVLQAGWVSPRERQAAVLFRSWLTRWMNPDRVFPFGFRFDIQNLAARSPIDPAHGANPERPQVFLPVPDGVVLATIQAFWLEDRKPADLAIVVDTSFSSYESDVLPAAQRNFNQCLDELGDRDRVAIVGFDADVTIASDLKPVAERDELERRMGLLFPGGESADLAGGLEAAMQVLRSAVDPLRVNGVLALTDGVGIDAEDLRELEESLAASPSEQLPIRLFPILYGDRAQEQTRQILDRIAQRTTGWVVEAGETGLGEACHDVVSEY